MIYPRSIDHIHYEHQCRYNRLAEKLEAAERERDHYKSLAESRWDGAIEANQERDALAAHVELKEDGRHEDADVSHLSLSQRVQRARQVEHDSRFIEALIDDQSVTAFSGAMKHKLMCARHNGRHGWYDPDLCTPGFLSDLLVEHLSKGNEGTFEDIANFAMMLHQRGEAPAVLAASLVRRDLIKQAESLDEVVMVFSDPCSESALDVVEYAAELAAMKRRQAEDPK